MVSGACDHSKKNHFYDPAEVSNVNYFKNLEVNIELLITCKILKSGQV